MRETSSTYALAGAAASAEAGTSPTAAAARRAETLTCAPGPGVSHTFGSCTGSHAGRPTGGAAVALALAFFAAAPAQAEGLTPGGDLPPGTEACDLHAWSADLDPRGLNVRAAPLARARVLGTLPPPFRYRSSAEVPDGGYRTEFRIVGHAGGERDGWFLIEGAEPPGRRYEVEDGYPRRHPKPYAGRGWISVAKVGANYANGGTRLGGLFGEPREDAPWTPAHDAAGAPIDGEGGPRRILACRGAWAHVESHDGVRGWWRYLCSNQVTNCS